LNGRVTWKGQIDLRTAVELRRMQTEISFTQSIYKRRGLDAEIAGCDKKGMKCG